MSINTPSAILTLGLGGTPSLMVTLGYGLGAPLPPAPSTDTYTGGFLPWKKSPQAKRFEEMEALRKEAQELIDRSQKPSADLPALKARAETVSLLLKEDIERLERSAQAYQAKLAEKARKDTRAKLMAAQNDALATRMLQAQVIDAQLKAQALVEELDVVFVAVALLMED